MSVGVVDGGAVAEVADRLAGVLGATKEHGVGSLGSAKSELVKGDVLATGLGDAGSDGVGESQSADRELRDLKQSGIISDGSNQHGSLGLLSLHESGQAGDGEGSLVDLRHAQPLLDASGELGVSSAGQEAIKFN